MDQNVQNCPKMTISKDFLCYNGDCLGGFSNRLAELFQYYVFSTNQYLYFDLYVAECNIQKI